MDDEATVIDLDPPAGLRDADNPSERAARTEREPMTHPRSGRNQIRGSDTSSQVGGEDAFILAWGRSHAALGSKTLQLWVSMALNVALVGIVGFLAWRNERKEPLVFVRDHLGNVIQADAASFLHAGDARSEIEIKGFMRRWVLDAFTWTPLDVQDRLEACLRVVDGRAQAVTRAGLRLDDRQRLVERGTSGRVYDDKAAGREPQLAITRRIPLEVMVSFDHYLIEKGGRTTDGGHFFVRAILKEVPRASVNPSGLMIADIQVSQDL